MRRGLTFIILAGILLVASFSSPMHSQKILKSEIKSVTDSVKCQQVSFSFHRSLSATYLYAYLDINFWAGWGFDLSYLANLTYPEPCYIGDTVIFCADVNYLSLWAGLDFSFAAGVGLDFGMYSFEKSISLDIHIHGATRNLIRNGTAEFTMKTSVSKPISGDFWSVTINVDISVYGTVICDFVLEGDIYAINPKGKIVSSHSKFVRGFLASLLKIPIDSPGVWGFGMRNFSLTINSITIQIQGIKVVVSIDCKVPGSDFTLGPEEFLIPFYYNFTYSRLHSMYRTAQYRQDDEGFIDKYLFSPLKLNMTALPPKKSIVFGIETSAYMSITTIGLILAVIIGRVLKVTPRFDRILARRSK